MIPIRKIRIETDKQDVEIFSTLNWNTHPVQNIWISKTNYFTTNHTRQLLGKINKEKSEFILTRQRSFIESFLPQIVVRGKLLSEAEKKTLILEFHPGIYTTAYFIFLLWATGSIIWNAINSLADSEAITNCILWIITIPLFTVLITIWELNKTKDKIFGLLQIRIRKAS